MKITIAVQLVLQALDQLSPTDSVYGLKVAEQAELPPGTVYPILKRLADEGWLERLPEADEKATGKGGSPRIYYRWTSKGRSAFDKLREERQQR